MNRTATAILAERRIRAARTTLIVLCALGGAGLPLSATASPASEDVCFSIGPATFCNDQGGGAPGNPGDVAENAYQLQSGLYLGHWHDGRPMVERVTVTPNQITLTRVAGGDVEGTTSHYIRSGANQYNSTSGHKIYITGPSSFTWTNSNGQNGVSYLLQ
jgi:hypothetical protein